MALRIKSHWHDENGERSLQEIAGAIAFISWRVATDMAINLHGERFVYDSDEQRMAVIKEYLYFQIQIVDRMAHGVMDDADRRTLIVQLALKLAGHVQDNSMDLFEPGDYGKPFIDTLNQRSAEYAELNFTDEGPSYPFLRHLGHEIQIVMGEREENRWVIDQVMDKDGWEVYKKLSRALRDLLE
jgi:hypothetical protein